MSQFEEHRKSISSLSTFVLNNANIEQFKQHFKKQIPITVDKHTKKIKKPIEAYYSPVGTTDTLFWCFYIIQYSVTHYELNQNNLFQLEKQQKFQLLEDFRKHNDILKLHKLKQPLIENNLCNEQKTTIVTFKALCLLKKLNVLLVNDRFHLEFRGDTECEKTHVIHLINKKYSVELEVTQINVDKYRKDLYLIDNPVKPLLSISSYKIQALKDISVKLCISLPERATKKTIYNEITSYIKLNLF